MEETKPSEEQSSSTNTINQGTDLNPLLEATDTPMEKDSSNNVNHNILPNNTEQSHDFTSCNNDQDDSIPSIVNKEAENLQNNSNSSSEIELKSKKEGKDNKESNIVSDDETCSNSDEINAESADHKETVHSSDNTTDTISLLNQTKNIMSVTNDQTEDNSDMTERVDQLEEEEKMDADEKMSEDQEIIEAPVDVVISMNDDVTEESSKQSQIETTNECSTSEVDPNNCESDNVNDVGMQVESEGMETEEYPDVQESAEINKSIQKEASVKHVQIIPNKRTDGLNSLCNYGDSDSDSEEEDSNSDDDDTQVTIKTEPPDTDEHNSGFRLPTCVPLGLFPAAPDVQEFDLNKVKEEADEEISFLQSVEKKNVYRSEIDIASSSDSESDSESSSGSESDLEEEAPVKQTPPTTKGETLLEELPELDKLVITVPEDQVKLIGTIYNIVNKQVLVQASFGMSSIDLDTVLFLNHGKDCLGKIFDVFGPIKEPMYSIIMSKEDQESGNITIGSEVFYAPTTEHTQYLLLDELLNCKGSDASWLADNEVPSQFAEYSDDEEERAAKQKKKNKKRPLEVKEEVIVVEEKKNNPFNRFGQRNNYNTNNYNQSGNPRFQNSQRPWSNNNRNPSPWSSSNRSPSPWSRPQNNSQYNRPPNYQSYRPNFSNNGISAGPNDFNNQSSNQNNPRFRSNNSFNNNSNNYPCRSPSPFRPPEFSGRPSFQNHFPSMNRQPTQNHNPGPSVYSEPPPFYNRPPIIHNQSAPRYSQPPPRFNPPNFNRPSSPHPFGSTQPMPPGDNYNSFNGYSSMPPSR